MVRPPVARPPMADSETTPVARTVPARGLLAAAGAAAERNTAAAGSVASQAVPVYALERGKFVVDRLARKWSRSSGDEVATQWVHDSEHDLHYVVFVREEQQLACTAFLGRELTAVHEDSTTVDQLKEKLRGQLSAAQLV